MCAVSVGVYSATQSGSSCVSACYATTGQSGMELVYLITGIEESSILFHIIKRE